jgi:thiamine pyrophosphate-dependent acetolactate synthase large subunit-like protein
LIRREAVEIVAKTLGHNIAVSANGYVSRDLYETHDRPLNFYMIGSMGLASSIGLGLAMKNPQKCIYVFDGDGNILMNLGSLVTIGSVRPKNLIHLVFDNRSHESTGGQPTNSSNIRIDLIAKAANYKVFKANSKGTLEIVLNKIKNVSGPTLVLIQIEKSKHVSKRIDIDPPMIKTRFMKALDSKK